MELYDASDAVMCRAFSLTLSNVARLWFKQLKPRSISSFAELSDAFIANFLGRKKRLTASVHLNNIVQKEGELLKDYIKRFNLEALQVRKHSDEIALNSIMQGVRDKPFLLSLDKNPQSTSAEFMTRAEKYTNVEETRILQEAAQNKNASAKQSAKKETKSVNISKKWKDDRSRDKCKSSKQPDSKFTNYTPLNKPQEQVLMEIKGENFVSWLNKLREIERLIREGHLGEHVDQGARTMTAEECPSDNRPIEEIRTILSGHLGGGNSNNAWKTHVRNMSWPEFEIMILAQPMKERKLEKYNLTFTEEDARGIHYRHDDALVITVTITNLRVFRVLIDTGSSTDVLFTQAFNRMGIEQSSLCPVKTPLIGFSGRQVLPEGAI
ncbi:uncharacterized protein LOC131249526 [Magnolia sinica]|uniref:uncharacterized protein LOC131238697 n=1 Tax=Magnolia sinica TaxID=86752 RepID=UPI002658B88C|nr:uncharacterized protein LOC131238697 [Magnolia sinica]XP_058106314.1 uncharacterized protein LOC131249526 [Magnolia sinica]